MKYLDALRQQQNTKQNLVIPDIKCLSPKEGDLLLGRDPVQAARLLVAAGAPALSVVTEKENFGGSLELLRQVAGAVPVPVLRKDFIQTSDDLLETQKAGAAAILLMCSCLKKERLAFLYQEALALGLDPLVEVHTLEEAAFAQQLGAKLLGINNRDILNLERDNGDVSRTRVLAKAIPAEAFLVSESSLMTPRDVRTAIRSGANAALVGTAIWQAADMAAFYKRLCRKTGVKICGLMNPHDLLACEKAGVDTLGFVVEYPLPVPWNLDRSKAKELLAQVGKGCRTSIVTGGTRENILLLAKELHPDMVQLHYQETLADTRSLASELKQLGIQTIKTIPIKASERLQQFGTTDTAKIVSLLDETEVAALLVDSRGPANAAQEGQKTPFDEFVTVQKQTKKQAVLAGGLTPGNITEALAQTGAEEIDIMTGVEDSPGLKSAAKLNVLMARLEEIER